jgi:hypothetical protein
MQKIVAAVAEEHGTIQPMKHRALLGRQNDLHPADI